MSKELERIWESEANGYMDTSHAPTDVTYLRGYIGKLQSKLDTERERCAKEMRELEEQCRICGETAAGESECFARIAREATAAERERCAKEADKAQRLYAGFAEEATRVCDLDGAKKLRGAMAALSNLAATIRRGDGR